MPVSIPQRSFRALRNAATTAVASALALGGCSGSNSTSPSAPPPPPPPALAVVYPSSLDLPINSPMAPVAPTVIGSPTSFSASPAFPPGVSLDSNTGVISGTPAKISARAQYTVTAAASSGSATAKLWISVHDSAPVVMYESPVYSITIGLPASMAPLNPAPGGGTALSWSTTAALPPGLSLDPATGLISGVATAASAPAAYKITATNQVGTSSGTITIGAYPSTSLLDVSLEGAVDTLRFSNSRVLAANDRQWVLKNFANAQTLAHGDAACLTTANPPCAEPTAEMIGDTVLIDALGGFSVRSAADGHVLWTVTAAAIRTLMNSAIYWVRLAMDASYVAAGTPNGLIIWPIDGSTPITVPGDYSQAITSARPGFVLVANGPAGTNVIEQVSATTGARSTGPPFTGLFQGWFQDGSAFSTNIGPALAVVSYDGLPLDQVPITEPTGLGGLGQWFWTDDASHGLNIFRLGASTTPVYTNSTSRAPYTAVASGSGVALWLHQQANVATSDQLQLVDLSTGSPVVTTAEPVPAQFGAYAWSAAAVSANSWVLGSLNGLVYDGMSAPGKPRFLTHGDTLAFAGGGNQVSVATADGNVYSFDASTYSLTSTVAVATDYMVMSRDGSALAVRSSSPGTNYASVYSPSTGALLYQLQTDVKPQQLLMSGSGTSLTVDFNSTSPTFGCNAMIVSVPDGLTKLCYKNLPVSGSRVFNPDAPLAAVNDWIPDYTNIKNPIFNSSYRLYSNDAYLSGGTGWVVPGWLDASRFVTAAYQSDTSSMYYVGPNALVDSTGKVDWPYARDLLDTAVDDSQSLSVDGYGMVLSASTGAVKWKNGNTSTGWIRGNYFIFKFDGQLLTEPVR